MFKLLPISYLIVPGFVCLLLLFGCGAEEIVNSPVSEREMPAPKSPNYFPVTLSSRWVYRNPDGSEWSREVGESQVFDAERYYSYSYEPAIRLDSLGGAEYLAYFDRIVRRTNLKEINDVVWETIVESGRGMQNWNIGYSCATEVLGNGIVCESNKIMPGILTHLYYAKPRVVWYSKLTPLQYPDALFPIQTFTALELRLTGRSEASEIHDFEAEWWIIGKIGKIQETVKTPAGAFEDCLRIQYEAQEKSFTTKEFREHIPDFAISVDALRKLYESETLKELTALLTSLTPKLGLQTIWLAPGVGPVKIETRDGIAELIDYQITPVQ